MLEQIISVPSRSVYIGDQVAGAMDTLRTAHLALAPDNGSWHDEDAITSVWATLKQVIDELEPVRSHLQGAGSIIPEQADRGVPAADSEPSGLVLANRSHWEERVKAWRACHNDCEAHCGEEPDDRQSSEHGVWEKAQAKLYRRDEILLVALIGTPTPDVAAFAEKVAIYSAQYQPGEPLLELLNDAVCWAARGMRDA